jgi:hypothetical protein
MRCEINVGDRMVREKYKWIKERGRKEGENDHMAVPYFPMG